MSTTSQVPDLVSQYESEQQKSSSAIPDLVSQYESRSSASPAPPAAPSPKPLTRTQADGRLSRIGSAGGQGSPGYRPSGIDRAAGFVLNAQPDITNPDASTEVQAARGAGRKPVSVRDKRISGSTLPVDESLIPSGPVPGGGPAVDYAPGGLLKSPADGQLTHRQQSIANQAQGMVDAREKMVATGSELGGNVADWFLEEAPGQPLHVRPEVKGAARSAGKFAGSMAGDPVTYALMGAGATGEVGGRLMSAGFAANAAKDIPEQSRRLGAIWDSPDISREQKAEAATDLILNSLFVSQMGMHTVRPRPVAPPLDPATQALANYERSTGNPDFQLPPEPPKPKLVFDPQKIAAIGEQLSGLNPDQKQETLVNLHKELAKQILDQGTYVDHNGQLQIVKTPEEAEKQAQGIINDSVQAHDKRAEATVKAAEASKQEKPQATTQTPQAQPTNPRVQRLIDRGKAQPAITTSAKLPDYLRENIEQNYQQAQRLGIADDIEELSAQGLTAKQVTAKLKDRFGSTPPEDHATIVRSTRAARGIPSQDNMAEFEAWRKQRSGQVPQMGRGMTQDNPAVAAAQQAPTVPGQTPLIAVKEETQANLEKLNQPPRPVNPEDAAQVGTKDDESGRKVLQPSESKIQNERLASDAAPELTTALSEVSASVEGAKFDRIRPQKNLERLGEKEGHDKPPETIGDYLAAQISAETPKAKDDLIAALKQKFNVVDVEDKFLEGRPDKAGYPSANVQVQLSNGVSAEIQIVPREVQEITDQSHHYYTQGREAKTDAERKELWDKAAEINGAALGRFKERNGIGKPQRTYDEVQADIDRREDQLEQQDSGIRAKMPPDLEKLYSERDKIGSAELKQNTEEIFSRLKTVGLSDEEADRIMNEYELPRGETTGAQHYLAVEHTQKAASRDPRKQAADIYVALADERGIFFDDADDLWRDRKTTEDAVKATIAIYSYFNGERPAPDSLPALPESTATPDLVAQYEGRPSLIRTEKERNGYTGPERRAKPNDPIRATRITEYRRALEAAERSGDLVAQHEAQEAINWETSRQRGEHYPIGESTVEGITAEEVNKRALENVPEQGNAPTPGTAGQVATRDLNFDPKRFQYKTNVNERGVTNLLAGKRYNPELAGEISVWRDPADGKMYVINGHHRAQLAVDSGQQNMRAWHIDVSTAEAARARGALQNIADGRGTAVDAAKFFRDSGMTQKDLDAEGISMGEATASNGLALSRLDPSVFEKVATGQMTEARGVAIGEATADAAQQEAIVKLIEKQEARGRKITNDTISELARFVANSGNRTAEQGGLFGSNQEIHSLALEKAEASAYIKQQIAKERRTFAAVSTQDRAQALSQVKGQQIKAGENAKISQDAAQAEEAYNKLSSSVGPVSNILEKAARDLASGNYKPEDIKRIAYQSVREEIRKTLSGGQEGSTQGLQGPAEEQPVYSKLVPDEGPLPEELRRGASAEAQQTNPATYPHLGKDIPKAEPIPQEGTFAAVRTDDGQIFTDRQWKNSTHILFMKRAGIPPDRVTDAGWVKDGVYEPSARSDAGAYAERARATKRAVEKRDSRSAVIDKAVEEFGLTEDPRRAGYILPDGRMLDFHRDSHYDTPFFRVHSRVEKLYPGEYPKNDSASVDRFLRDSGSARMDMGGWFGDQKHYLTIHVPEGHEFTAQQRTAIDTALSKLKNGEEVVLQIGNKYARELAPRATLDSLTSKASENPMFAKEWGTGMAPGELDNWIKAAGKNLRVEERGEQNTLFGAADKMYQLTNQHGERTVITESQLKSLSQKFPNLASQSRGVVAGPHNVTWDYQPPEAKSLFRPQGGTPTLTLSQEAMELMHKVAGLEDFSNQGMNISRGQAEKIAAKLSAPAFINEAATARIPKGYEQVTKSLGEAIGKASNDAGNSGVHIVMENIGERVTREEQFHGELQRELGEGEIHRHLPEEAATRLLEHPAAAKLADELTAKGYSKDAPGWVKVAEISAKIATGDLGQLSPSEAADWFDNYLSELHQAHGEQKVSNLVEVLHQKTQDIYNEARQRINARETQTRPGPGEGEGRLPQTERGLRENQQTGPPEKIAGQGNRSDAAGAPKEAAVEEPLFSKEPDKPSDSERLYDEELAKLNRPDITSPTRIVPGGKSAYTGNETGLNEIQQLTQSISKGAPGVSLLNRLKNAANIGQKAAPGNTFSSVMGRIKGNIAGWIDAYKRPPKWSDYEDATGKWSGADQRSALDLYRFSKAIKDAVPDKLRREAISNWIEAAGDEATLRVRADASDKPYKAGYEAALNLTDHEKTVAQNIMNLHDSTLQEAIKAGILEGGVENYVQHIYKDKPGMVERIRAQLNFNSLNPNPAFAKKRVLPTYFDAEQLGFTPKDKDVGYLTSVHERSLREALAARAYIKSLMEGKTVDGKPLIATSWASAKEIGDPGDEAYLIKPNMKSGEKLEGYIPLDHPALRGWKWAGEVDGKQVFVQGDALVHRSIFQKLKNNLSKSAFRSYEVNVGDKTIRPGEALLNAQSQVKHAILSFSGFHQATLGIHALEHRTLPAGMPDLDLNVPEQSKLVDHGLMIAHYDAEEGFGEGVSSGGLVTKIPAIGPAYQTYVQYLFKDYMPRLKMQMALNALERNEHIYEGKLSEDQIYAQTAKEANAAFGGLNYRMLGRNKTLQDVLRLGLMAPDFLEARGRFAGQAAKPYGREQMVALLGGALAMYTAARIINQMSDDDPHWDKPFSVIYKGKEYGLRTVQGDLVNMATDWRRFWRNRLSPGASFLVKTEDARQNKDESFTDKMKHKAENVAPIPLQPWLRHSDDSTAQKVVETILKMVGVNSKTDPESARATFREQIGVKTSKPTAALRTMYELMKDNMPPLTAERAADLKAKHERMINGNLSQKERIALERERNLSEFEYYLPHLELRQMKRVYKDATPEERKTILPLMQEKAYRLVLRDPAEAMRQKVEEVFDMR